MEKERQKQVVMERESALLREKGRILQDGKEKEKKENGSGKGCPLCWCHSQHQGVQDTAAIK